MSLHVSRTRLDLSACLRVCDLCTILTLILSYIEDIFYLIVELLGYERDVKYNHSIFADCCVGPGTCDPEVLPACVLSIMFCGYPLSSVGAEEVVKLFLVKSFLGMGLYEWLIILIHFWCTLVDGKGNGRMKVSWLVFV